ncbi:MAG: Thymidine kinase [Candidatus Heimdallarchaeota archaeon LC_2]|nr:MAG: Thymidine kinase [Candidatus Heimdallarchaeota archaeon LC_2]
MNKFNTTYNEGSIEVIVGTMFSGKSRELLYRGTRAERYGQIPVYYFKPSIDTRDGEYINSRDGITKKASLFKQSRELLEKLNDKPGLVLIDEAQFADKNIVYVSQLLKRKGYNIVISGLPNDYRGQPFGVMPELMALSDAPIKNIFSVCNIDGCHNDGVLPQRLRNGEPDSALSPTIIIEGSDNKDKIEYEPRCELHHKVPEIDKYLEKQMEPKDC